MSVTLEIVVDESEYVLIQAAAAYESLDVTEFISSVFIERLFSDRRFYRSVVKILRQRRESVLQISTAGSIPIITMFAALTDSLLAKKTSFERRWDTDGQSAAVEWLGDQVFAFLDFVVSTGQLPSS